MRKELVEYRKRIDDVIEDPESGFYDGIVKDHLAKISFFQHERLIHLLVTLAFALMEIVSLSVAVIANHLVFLALAMLILVLLVPYIVHYYFLENETQKLYAQYDQLREIENTVRRCD